MREAASRLDGREAGPGDGDDVASSIASLHLGRGARPAFTPTPPSPGSSAEPSSNHEPERLIFSSIGTVLIDCFDPPSRAPSHRSCSGSSTPRHTSRPSSAASSLSASTGSLRRQSGLGTARVLTPQLDFPDFADDPEVEALRCPTARVPESRVRLESGSKSGSRDSHSGMEDAGVGEAAAAYPLSRSLTRSRSPSPSSSPPSSSPSVMSSPISSSATLSEVEADVGESSTTPTSPATSTLLPLPPVTLPPAVSPSAAPPPTVSKPAPLRQPPIRVPAGATEQLGGGALYALIGARIWLPPSRCRTLVDRQAPGPDGLGSDLSPELEKMLEGYGKGCWAYVQDEGRRMVRARIRYEGDARMFKSIVAPQTRSFHSILHSPLRSAEYLHIAPPYCPDDLRRLLKEMRQAERAHQASQREVVSPDGAGGALAVGEAFWRPKIVYEPHPVGCHPGQREALEEVLGEIDILSPNHEELLSLYARPLVPLSSPDLRPALEQLIAHILARGLGAHGAGAIVVRCGRMGSVVGTRQGGVRWFPAYWEGEDERRVKDVTGAGNAYLGGFIAGLSKSAGDPYTAALYGTVSASFVVEQMGLPKLGRMTAVPLPLFPIGPTFGDSQFSSTPASAPDAQPAPTTRSPLFALPRSSVGRQGEEMWNGDVPSHRLRVFQDRVAGRGLDC